FQANNSRKLFTDYANTLVFARRQIESDLECLLSLNTEDSDPENNKEVLEGIERSEEYIELFDDLEKLYKLLEKKGIKAGYLELITLLSNIITENFRKNGEEGYKPFFVKMSNRLGENASKEEVIKEWLTIMHDTGNHPSIISVVLDRFNIKYEMQELGGLVDRLNEEIDLETFEKDLESSNKIIAIEELSKLSGNNLENHLEAIFGRLGWDVQELHLFDNQAAEFIVTGDDEAIAVRFVIGAEEVTENEIQKVLSLKKKYLVAKYMVVTDGIFTNNAARYAGSNNIELLDGKKLRKMLRRSKPSASDIFLDQTVTSSDQLSFGVLSTTCPFCESDIQIEQEKLPGQDEQYI
ncbi:MAG: restriction endonuclease, partial [Candidatus Heimdallarchaeota archaeon]